MPRRLLPAAVLVVLLAGLVSSGCSSKAAPQPSTPGATVAAWLAAVDAGDRSAIGSLVVDGAVAIVLAVENGLEPEQLAAHLDNGLPGDVTNGYWRSFSAEFADFAGRPLSTLVVGEAREFVAEGRRFAVVEVRAEDRGRIYTRDLAGEGEQPAWAVDLVATVAPGMISALRAYHDALPPDDAGRRVERAYAEIVVPSLWAVLGSGGADDDFTRQALDLIEEVVGG